MCGRYALATPTDTLAAHFAAPPPAVFQARYNIAPTQPVLALISGDQGNEFTHFRWGLIPSWAKDPSIGARMINARAETAAEKPAFRAALRRRRCLLPASGYFEWVADGRARQPHFIVRTDPGCLALAGIWETWERDGNLLQTCAILTCAANSDVENVHARMPVCIASGDYQQWLSDLTVHEVVAMLQPAPAGSLRSYPVSRRVNSPRNDDPDCIEPQPTAAAALF